MVLLIKLINDTNVWDMVKIRITLHLFQLRLETRYSTVINSMSTTLTTLTQFQSNSNANFTLTVLNTDNTETKPIIYRLLNTNY